MAKITVKEVVKAKESLLPVIGVIAISAGLLGFVAALYLHPSLEAQLSKAGFEKRCVQTLLPPKDYTGMDFSVFGCQKFAWYTPEPTVYRCLFVSYSGMDDSAKYKCAVSEQIGH